MSNLKKKKAFAHIRKLLLAFSTDYTIHSRFVIITASLIYSIIITCPRIFPSNLHQSYVILRHTEVKQITDL